MNKLFIILCLMSLVSSQLGMASISSRLNSQVALKAKSADKDAKTIVACACDDLFPVMQEVLLQSKSEIKKLAKAQLQVMNLNKEQLHLLKRMIQENAPLAQEGVHVYGAFIKKHGKSIMNICKTNVIQMLTVDKHGESPEGVILGATNEQGAALMGMIALFARDSQCNAYLEKVAAANDKWDSLLESLFDSMQKEEAVHLQEVKRQEMGFVLQNILAAVLNNKRVMKIQSSLIPILQNSKTQIDVVRLVQACLNEFEAKLPALVVSAEKFGDFAIPFLAMIINESIDESLQSMPA